MSYKYLKPKYRRKKFKTLLRVCFAIEKKVGNLNFLDARRLQEQKPRNAAEGNCFELQSATGKIFNKRETFTQSSLCKGCAIKGMPIRLPLNQPMSVFENAT